MEGIPGRTGHASSSLNGSAKHDELHAVDDRRSACAADERLDEGLECVHVG